MPNVSNSLYYIEDWNLKLNGLFDLSQINSQNSEYSPDFNLKTYQDLLCKSIGWFLYDRTSVMKEFMHLSHLSATAPHGEFVKDSSNIETV